MKRKKRNLSLNKKMISKLSSNIYKLRGGDEGQTTSIHCTDPPTCTTVVIDTYDNSGSINPYCLNAGSLDGCTA